MARAHLPIAKRITTFHGRRTPEEAILVGYGALIEAYRLPMPIPDQMALISTRTRQYDTPDWKVFPPRYQPEDELYKHLVFALKYEGVNLLFFKKLLGILPKKEITNMIQAEPTGQYSRKIWFLYEWLLAPLPIPDASSKIKYTPLLDDALQYAVAGAQSPRHRIINNLPGTKDFCPLIRKTEKLEQMLAEHFNQQTHTYLKGIRKDILQRTSAFLLLKDSRASFTIEGESPGSKRTARWGQAIGQAGKADLSKDELIRLQQLVIENDRFVQMGFRRKGGFIGEHDRSTGEPIPDHVSARWQDLDPLIDGLIHTHDVLFQNDFDAVLAATMIAFGFVFIHPFEDGNGRIHRYLLHHVLARKKFTPQGIIFPLSASILDHIDDYRKVLEAYSHPLLDFIDWKETKDHNVEVLNETIDYYRYFDATKQAEFLFGCVQDTLENIIPAEVTYLTKYDEIKQYLQEEYEMPDDLIAMAVRFLEQHSGKFSKRAREKEFSKLNEQERITIETKYAEIFG